MSIRFCAPLVDKNRQEKGELFAPRFNGAGLLTAVVTDEVSGDVLMVAYMNEQALQLTLESGIGHFWSRSRKSLWKKGESSGNLLRVKEIRADCDQDAVWLKVRVEGQGAACHTGAAGCFYRQVVVEGSEAKLRLDA